MHSSCVSRRGAEGLEPIKTTAKKLSYFLVFFHASIWRIQQMRKLLIYVIHSAF